MSKQTRKLKHRRYPTLSSLSNAQRTDELWEDGWLRVFTDGSVSNPSDPRLALGGGGIYFGRNHAYNTAAEIHGRGLNSYRAELQAVRLLLSGAKQWHSTKLWITLDNKAVVNDINKILRKEFVCEKIIPKSGLH